MRDYDRPRYSCASFSPYKNVCHALNELIKLLILEYYSLFQTYGIKIVPEKTWKLAIKYFRMALCLDVF